MCYTYIQWITRFLKTDIYVKKVENKKRMTTIFLIMDLYVKKFCKENTEIRQEIDDHFLKTDSYVQNISKK